MEVTDDLRRYETCCPHSRKEPACPLIDIICKTEVCQDNTAPEVGLHDEHILWLDISVGDRYGMHVLYAENDLARNGTTVPISEAPPVII